MDEIRQKLYSETRQDLLNRQLSNSQNYDRAILTLSTASLGFSLAFIKGLVPLNEAEHLWLLYFSWIIFIVAIFLTLMSFISSQVALGKQLEYAKYYYLEEKKAFENKTNWMADVTNWIFYTVWFIFMLGVILTMIFVKINLSGGNT